MRISDWSSDVCSSDLDRSVQRLAVDRYARFHSGLFRLAAVRDRANGCVVAHARDRTGEHAGPRPAWAGGSARAGHARAGLLSWIAVARKIGRASWRERVCTDV